MQTQLRKGVCMTTHAHVPVMATRPEVQPFNLGAVESQVWLCWDTKLLRIEEKLKLVASLPRAFIHSLVISHLATCLCLLVLIFFRVLECATNWTPGTEQQQAEGWQNPHGTRSPQLKWSNKLPHPERESWHHRTRDIKPLNDNKKKKNYAHKKLWRGRLKKRDKLLH